MSSSSAGLTPQEQEQTHAVWSVPVGLSGEDADHGGSLVDLQHVGERLKDVEVEERVSRN